MAGAHEDTVFVRINLLADTVFARISHSVSLGEDDRLSCTICAGHGWPSVPVAMDGEKGPLAMDGCSHGRREGTLPDVYTLMYKKKDTLSLLERVFLSLII
ncbi:hypothetical protein [Desulfosporosinus sp. I2]|uniref:hypothetical protein n=1 Tax=Desulfosporosinus sp. I2 TaxID=1617025 RepID=UPI0005ED5D7E|nr:hypothetical protein [Desulfosporosinus sp. I2]